MFPLTVDTLFECTSLHVARKTCWHCTFLQITGSMSMFLLFFWQSKWHNLHGSGHWQLCPELNLCSCWNIFWDVPVWDWHLFHWSTSCQFINHWVFLIHMLWPPRYIHGHQSWLMRHCWCYSNWINKVVTFENPCWVQVHAGRKQLAEWQTFWALSSYFIFLNDLPFIHRCKWPK